MAALILQLKSAEREVGTETPLESVSLTGLEGSPAASLDYAIAKETSWLQSMFGLDFDGSLVAKKIFRRRNPERRRPGPVVISIDPELLSAQNIQIFVDGETVSNSIVLRQMAEQILATWRGRQPKSSSRTLKMDRSKPSLRNLDFGSFRKEFFVRALSEIQNVLRRGDIFSRPAFNRRLDSILSSSQFRGQAGTNWKILQNLDQPRSSSERLGMECLGNSISQLRRYAKKRPLTVVFSGAMDGTTAIFSHIAHNLRLPLSINSCFEHSLEIIDYLEKQNFELPPDICVFGQLPSAYVLRRSRVLGFRPLLLMPPGSHRIVTSARNARTPELNSGVYCYMKDVPATVGLYFDDLVDSKLIHKSKVGIRHANPEESFQILNSGNSEIRAVLAYPHYHFHVLAGHSELLPHNHAHLAYRDAILFVHESLFADSVAARALEILVRDAWLTLRDDPAVLRGVVQQMFDDEQSVKYLYRLSGLANVRERHDFAN